MSLDTGCPHINELLALKPPKLSQSVHREECTQCFDNQDGPLGVDVCLACFNGACLNQDRHHARTHVSQSGHAFTLNVKRSPKNKSSSREPPAKMTKLAIVEEREENKFEHSTAIKCWKCNPEDGKVIVVDNPATRSLVDEVLHSLSSARQSEVKAWEEEITACEHTLLLEQVQSAPIPPQGLAHCTSCDLTSNLWLCLSCGALGCGRAQFGGVGGNGHALAHFNESGHAACVKLGTITPEGGADIYCYACNDARLDPDLATHLKTFGISVATQKKTEKSMTELQIEQNLTFDFSLTAEDGSALEPIFGPGTTGLSNLGNRRVYHLQINPCYMASVLQMLFSLPAFRARYFGQVPGPSQGTKSTPEVIVSPQAILHWSTCSQALPADCLDCQLFKIADGLLSGRYSKPHHDSLMHIDNPLAHAPVEKTPWQVGLKPAGFKALVGRGHAEFATMRQQDAEEFFGHLLTVLRRHNHTRGEEPTETFAFGLEQRLQCQSCQRVRYRVDTMDSLSVAVGAPNAKKDNTGGKKYQSIQLTQCLDLLLGATGREELEYQCEGGCGKVSAVRQTQFASFPDVLVVHTKKFQLVNWVPTKLDIPIILPQDDVLTLDGYLGQGLQPDEIELPDSSSNPPSAPQFDPEAVALLEGMGFPTVRCQKALLATGNAGAEVAMEWLFGHMDDADIDDPIVIASSTGQTSGSEPSAEQVAMLADMGFSSAQAKKALRETGGDPERAVEWLFNHPDDTGEDVPPASGESKAAKALPGSTRLPARYRLKAFISHKGPSVHSGHYVAHIRIPGAGKKGSADKMNVDSNSADDWVFFNDEKVVLADKESVNGLKKLAYLYIFEKA
ncbi:hypothetical protein SERLA73DRAFT_62342 [Serpula lacrymans var. lacrymans S7.3]|uniref:Ubiquitin carboxyl-terminal hydrolase n=1 Tax=Serpula lacrymans var. lacrymans (strain S7.3) TaxID=936435 RepID=F8QBQ5_SERL3|nr:hypothetical protein SERLA73DRAFT_62342 [Serpula lacrymans var. lacrymans S7.3]